MFTTPLEIIKERLGRESDVIHKLVLRAPEEDEYLFIQNFSTLKTWSFAAMLKETSPSFIV